MPSPKKRLLTLLESAQVTLGDAVELILTNRHLEQSYRNEARDLAALILRLQTMADNLAEEERRKTA